MFTQTTLYLVKTSITSSSSLRTHGRPLQLGTSEVWTYSSVDFLIHLTADEDVEEGCLHEECVVVTSAARDRCLSVCLTGCHIHLFQLCRSCDGIMSLREARRRLVDGNFGTNGFYVASEPRRLRFDRMSKISWWGSLYGSGRKSYKINFVQIFTTPVI